MLVKRFLLLLLQVLLFAIAKGAPSLEVESCSVVTSLAALSQSVRDSFTPIDPRRVSSAWALSCSCISRATSSVLHYGPLMRQEHRY